MRTKRKWLIMLVLLPMLLLAVWLWTVGSRQIPVDVIGDFSEKEVAEIVAAAKREMRHEILPYFSWQSVKAMPAAFKRYSTIKLITVFRGGTNVAMASVWQETNGVTRFSSKTNYFASGSNSEPTIPSDLGKYLGLVLSNSSSFPLLLGTNGWQSRHSNY